MDNAELGEALLNLAKMITEDDPKTSAETSDESREASDEDLSGSIRRLARLMASDDDESSREAATDYDATDLIAKAYKTIVTAQPALRRDKAFQKAWMPVVDWATELDR